MNEIDSFIERLAQEVYDTECSGRVDDIARVLTRSLRPVLEAGQALHLDLFATKYDYDSLDAWDSALKGATSSRRSGTASRGGEVVSTVTTNEISESCPVCGSTSHFHCAKGCAKCDNINNPVPRYASLFCRRCGQSFCVRCMEVHQCGGVQ